MARPPLTPRAHQVRPFLVDNRWAGRCPRAREAAPKASSSAPPAAGKAAHAALRVHVGKAKSPAPQLRRLPLCRWLKLQRTPTRVLLAPLPRPPSFTRRDHLAARLDHRRSAISIVRRRTGPGGNLPSAASGGCVSRNSCLRCAVVLFVAGLGLGCGSAWVRVVTGCG